MVTHGQELKIRSNKTLRGRAVWSARRPHKPQVGGSNPSPAI